jgi:hypothetical protein
VAFRSSQEFVVPLFRPYEHRAAGTQDAEEDTELVAEPTSSTKSAPAGDHHARNADQPDTTVAASQTTRQSASQPSKMRQKKDRPTPSRAEAEEARRKQMMVTITPKEAKARNRELKLKASQQARERVEAAPERELLRDYIDSRWTIAEFIIPVFILLWAASLATVSNAGWQYLLSAVMAFAMLLMFANIWWLWRGFKREARQRLDHPSFRGLLFYGMNRMLWIRRFRNPGPRIKRGDPY